MLQPARVTDCATWVETAQPRKYQMMFTRVRVVGAPVGKDGLEVGYQGHFLETKRVPSDRAWSHVKMRDCADHGDRNAS
jgi:hypothetical protein